MRTVHCGCVAMPIPISQLTDTQLMLHLLIARTAFLERQLASVREINLRLTAHANFLEDQLADVQRAHFYKSSRLSMGHLWYGTAPANPIGTYGILWGQPMGFMGTYVSAVWDLWDS